MVSTAKRVEKPRIGVFGIGLAAYWPQFASLLERLTGYLHLIEERLGQWGGVVSGGLVGTDEAARAARDKPAPAQVGKPVTYPGTHHTPLNARAAVACS